MLAFPQLATGALSQYPARKQRTARTVANRAADGSSIKLADPTGALTEWELPYTDLSDAEADALEQFFAAAEGSLNGFTFLDPTANLLARSAQLSDAVWQRAPQLALAGGLADPFGGMGAFALSNQGAAAQGITQTLAAPGWDIYCLSVYARASAPANVTMLTGNSRAVRTVSATWRRLTLTGTGNAAETEIRFGLQLPAGATVEVFGFQAEAQPGASPYRSNEPEGRAGGVYQNARLRDDELQITTTAVNRHSCTLHVIHFNHF
jgi:hypothetical protein